MFSLALLARRVLPYHLHPETIPISSEIVKDLERLAAIEGIKRAKAVYWYAMDTKQWDLLRSVFTTNAVADFRDTRDFIPGKGYRTDLPSDVASADQDALIVRSASAIVSLIRKGVGDRVTVHQGAAPIIDITSPHQGKAIWPTYDLIAAGDHVLFAYGYYHETYRSEDGSWRIDTLQVRRLHMESRPASQRP